MYTYIYIYTRTSYDKHFGLSSNLLKWTNDLKTNNLLHNIIFIFVVT